MQRKKNRGSTYLSAGQPTGLYLRTRYLLAPVYASAGTQARLGTAPLPVEGRHAGVSVLGYQIVWHLTRFAAGHAPIRLAPTTAAYPAPAVHQAHRARPTRVLLARRGHLGHSGGRLRWCGGRGRGSVARERPQWHTRPVGRQPRTQSVCRQSGRHVRPVQARAQKLQTVIPAKRAHGCVNIFVSPPDSSSRPQNDALNR